MRESAWSRPFPPVVDPLVLGGTPVPVRTASTLGFVIAGIYLLNAIVVATTSFILGDPVTGAVAVAGLIPSAVWALVSYRTRQGSGRARNAMIVLSVLVLLGCLRSLEAPSLSTIVAVIDAAIVVAILVLHARPQVRAHYAALKLSREMGQQVGRPRR